MHQRHQILFAVIAALLLAGCSSEEHVVRSTSSGDALGSKGRAEGACCLEDGSCEILTAEDCAAMGGEYQGDEVSCDPNPCESSQYQGCGLGYWKNHLYSWEPTAYTPDDLASSVFTYPDELGLPSDDTLLDVLKYPGGSGALGAARLLLRTAVVALLNASHPDVNYPLSVDEIIQMVNEALATMDRRAMQEARHEINQGNGQGCPLN
jgi:hypothetical protein